MNYYKTRRNTLKYINWSKKFFFIPLVAHIWGNRELEVIANDKRRYITLEQRIVTARALIKSIILNTYSSTNHTAVLMTY